MEFKIVIVSCTTPTVIMIEVPRKDNELLEVPKIPLITNGNNAIKARQNAPIARIYFLSFFKNSVVSLPGRIPGIIPADLRFVCKSNK